MARLIWSPRAADDLESICEYIAKDSPQYAKTVAALIVNTLEGIPQFPKAGRVVPEIQDRDVRERIVGNFRVVYRIREDTVEVVTIIHGARLLRWEG